MKQGFILLSFTFLCIIMLAVSLRDTNRKLKNLEEYIETVGYQSNSIGEFTKAQYKVQCAYTIRLISTLPYDPDRQDITATMLQSIQVLDTLKSNYQIYGNPELR